jgi:hypothetical protein
MRCARKVLFLVLSLVVAAPLAWGAGGFRDSNLVKVTTVPQFARTRTVSSPNATLCHRPPGNPTNVQTIVVGNPAVPAHLAHGDTVGACPQDCPQECPDECPQECPEASSPVHRTGQTACWNDAGDPVACAGTGQDGEYQAGASASPRFTDSSDGTVTDNLTKLIWLKDADCFGNRSWGDALNVANTLATGSCGLTDGSAAGAWRLPNLKELQSLSDFGNFNPALPAGYPFIGVRDYVYWSSTSHVMAGGFGWYVSMADGTVSNAGKGNAFAVWPVRGGQ